MLRRVVVTGMGQISPLGSTLDALWRGLQQNRTFARRIQHFDAKGWPVALACEVEETFDGQHRISAMARWASSQAIEQAGIDRPPSYGGVFMGHGLGVIRPIDILRHIKGYDIASDWQDLGSFLERQDRFLLKEHAPRELTLEIAEKYGWLARAKSFLTACAGGAQAIGHAYEHILNGDLDVALSGGADSLAGEFLFAGFTMLGVLSTIKEPHLSCRPFDRQRSGLVASEGAAFLVLEELEHARRRKAKILAEVIGYGESENAYRLTDLPEDGHGAQSAMREALADIPLQMVGCVNAHGTGTEQNDRIEALAIEEVFATAGCKPWITANKSQLGHLVAASGAIEAICSVLSIQHQAVPPIANLEESNTSRKLRFVRGRSQSLDAPVVISNSFGFGGSNACLAFRDYIDES